MSCNLPLLLHRSHTLFHLLQLCQLSENTSSTTNSNNPEICLEIKSFRPIRATSQLPTMLNCSVICHSPNVFQLGTYDLQTPAVIFSNESCNISMHEQLLHYLITYLVTYLHKALLLIYIRPCSTAPTISSFMQLFRTCYILACANATLLTY